MESCAPHKALEEIFKVIQRANKYIDESMPWALAKDMDANGPRLAHVLYNLLEATRICGILLTPFIPASCDKLFAQIGACDACRSWDSAAVWGSREETMAVTKGRTSSPASTWTRPWLSWRPSGSPPPRPPSPPSSWSPGRRKWTSTPSAKSDFRVVKVKACEPVKKVQEALKVHPGRRHRHRPADPLRHRHVLQARGPGGQDPGGHRESAHPEDDGPAAPVLLPAGRKEGGGESPSPCMKAAGPQEGGGNKP